jgi:arylsulfatase A-like enzyme
VPALIKWPGVIEPSSVYNDVFAHEDFMPTLLAAVGDPDIKEKLASGQQVGERTYKVHLDGYNLLPFFKGEVQEAPRKEFLYWNDDGKLVALRYDQWKLVFAEQRAASFDVWQEPFVDLRVPKLFSLRADPFERADHEGIDYDRWRVERIFLLVPAQAFVANWLESFKEFPPRQKPASFSIDQVMARLQEGVGGNR